MDDQKEIQMENQRLKEENQALKLAAIDVNKFEEWEWDQILAWIMSCDDGRFKRYEIILAKNLKEEEISGVDLKDVDGADVKRWGITKFSDIKILCNHIKQLVDKNDNKMKDNDKIASVANEEGAVSGGYYK